VFGLRAKDLQDRAKKHQKMLEQICFLELDPEPHNRMYKKSITCFDSNKENSKPASNFNPEETQSFPNLASKSEQVSHSLDE
jgi:hypothetical protein